METLKFILNVLILVGIPLTMIWLWWRQNTYIKALRAVLGEINGMISEAKEVRDELQKLFDEFQQTIDNELKIEDLKAQIEAIVQEEQAMDKKSDEKSVQHDLIVENEPTKIKYLVRVKLDYFRRKFPDFDGMSQLKKDELVNKEFEFMTSILKGSSDKLAIFLNDDFRVSELIDNVEIYPLEDGDLVKFEGEELTTDTTD